MATLDDAIKAAEILSKSGLVPDKFKGKPADILVAMQWGAELGNVQPLQALNGIAVVNGTPSIYGDLGKALVLRAPDLVDFKLEVQGSGRDMKGYCLIVRGKAQGNNIAIERVFSMQDAERGGIASRGPWKQYPGRMLMWRAFWLAARDIYADVLAGMQGAEEMEDLPYEIKAQSSNHAPQPDSATDRVAKAAAKIGGSKHLYAGPDGSVVLRDGPPSSEEEPGVAAVATHNEMTEEEVVVAIEDASGVSIDALGRRSKAELIELLGDSAREQGCKVEDLVSIAAKVDVPYKGGSPATLTVAHLKDLIAAVWDCRRRSEGAAG